MPRHAVTVRRSCPFLFVTTTSSPTTATPGDGPARASGLPRSFSVPCRFNQSSAPAEGKSSPALDGGDLAQVPTEPTDPYRVPPIADMIAL